MIPTLKKIISGGQTGVDLMGVEAAREIGYETGGVVPRGWLTEYGPEPELHQSFGMVEVTEEQVAAYKGRNKVWGPRTNENAKTADATVWFGEHSYGYILTRRHTLEAGKLFIENPSSDELREFIIANDVAILNVAGNSFSKLGKYKVEIFKRDFKAAIQ